MLVHDSFFGNLGGYSVSNFGRIRNRWGRILKPQRRPHGYYQICLSYLRYNQWFYVHRLVAFAHIGSPNSLLDEVNHKDKNRGNNRADNLEWVSSSENKRHAYSYGSHSRRRFTQTQKQEVIQLRRRGRTLQEIADRFVCSKQSVWRHCREV